MINTFLNQINSFFDQRFVFAYLSPTFIGLGLSLVLAEVLFGPAVAKAFSWWVTLDGTEQVLLAVGVLIAITLLASLLEALTVPLVRLYEGYWPEGALTHYARNRQLRALNAVGSSSARYQNFPRDLKYLKPTRLGNVLVAAEEYSYQRYSLDAVTWWPRLEVLLPTSFRTQVDASLTPMLTALNLSLIITMLFLVGGVTAFLIDSRLWLSLVIFVVGLVLARACYLAAISQAVSYGQLVRVAFDFYRFEILKQMHIPLPDNYLEETFLWAVLNSVVYEYVFPWETTLTNDLPSLKSPFYYDMHQKSN